MTDTPKAWMNIVTTFINAVGTSSVVKGIKTVPSPEFSAEDIDVTSQDDTIKAFIAGLSEGNEVEFIMNDLPNDDGQKAIVAACTAKENGTFNLVFPSGRSIQFGVACKTAGLKEDNKSVALSAKFKVSGTVTWGTDPVKLSALAVSTGTLFPAFGVDVLEYQLPEVNATGTITVTPTSAGNTITVAGVAVTSGAASGNQNLTAGSITSIEIMVSKAGKTPTIYKIKAARAA